MCTFIVRAVYHTLCSYLHWHLFCFIPDIPWSFGYSLPNFLSNRLLPIIIVIIQYSDTGNVFQVF
jgi:hypothetical protein